MNKNLFIFCLAWFLVGTLLVMNSRAGSGSCRSEFTVCMQRCQDKYPIPDTDLRVDPGDMNKSTKAQQYEARKLRKECANSCKIEKQQCYSK